MRKKISCRMIESVPLNKSEDDLFHAHSSKPKNNGFNTRSSEDIPAIMRIYFNPDPTIGKLNILA